MTSTGEVPPSTTTREDVSTELPGLLPFFDNYPQIVYTKSDPSVGTLSTTLFQAVTPAAIIRARTEEHVQAAVKAARSANLTLGIRSGGNELAGRNLAGTDKGFLLDMRSMDSVTVADDRKTATIGGGILMGRLAPALADKGLFTPVGWHPAVGYAGWAMGGGYGCYSSMYGFGCDQILGARVVVADGTVVDVDERSHRDLLWALRGAGNGIWGVVTQLTIRIYPHPKLLNGTIEFQKEDWPAVLDKWAEEFEPNMPVEFAGDMYFRNPIRDKPEMVIYFAWCAREGEDLQKGYEYLERIRSLPGKATGSVAETDFSTPLSTLSVFAIGAFSVHHRGVVTNGISKAVASTLAHHWQSKTLYLGSPSHHGHGKAIEPDPGACYPLRYQHRLFPLVASGENLLTDQKVQLAVHSMADDMAKDLKATGDVFEGVANGNLIPPEDTDVDATFGKETVEKLRTLKRKYDPTNFFSGGYPVL
ncbi:FAD-binding domain-containing protein [Coniochaeta ligniaria NRRL 30616]|uniref:FAD-binding domain-containing protein n=1 Tax=Coniochaeta ligniaria NRRL 30616 TaxID=1408157 RepID=A0A1J7JQZ6_9PEZI|nr:FAD-binding domain-containing protein [Coniochaeta ligniaria NRRL 30616]